MREADWTFANCCTCLRYPRIGDIADMFNYPGKVRKRVATHLQRYQPICRVNFCPNALDATERPAPPRCPGTVPTGQPGRVT